VRESRPRANAGEDALPIGVPSRPTRRASPETSPAAVPTCGTSRTVRRTALGTGRGSSGPSSIGSKALWLLTTASTFSYAAADSPSAAFSIVSVRT